MIVSPVWCVIFLVQVLEEFNIPENQISKCLSLLRLASSFYPDDSDFMTIPLYKRYNRCRNGDLNINDDIPDVSFTDLNGKLIKGRKFFRAKTKRKKCEKIRKFSCKSVKRIGKNFKYCERKKLQNLMLSGGLVFAVRKSLFVSRASSLLLRRG